ncbi:uncharacterized serine-rich protein C215.13-like [Scaptodrosophila lebanonensis]|uniref:Uncharacterized serine-rich protein C215.13-like n=1 Tax=Drosophila lebanonensis TaxID=7225 RepID=A0A6J2TMT0_DROLE|nr:uncharacterized serine-rich protein C215.13-like [Scaptodrosophila lebanonensis]
MSTPNKAKSTVDDKSLGRPAARTSSTSQEGNYPSEWKQRSKSRPSSTSNDEKYPTAWKQNMKNALQANSSPRKVHSEGSIDVTQTSWQGSSQKGSISEHNKRIIKSVSETLLETSESEDPTLAAVASTTDSINATSTVLSLPSASRTSSISTIGSAQLSSEHLTLLSGSQTSGYTTESRYESVASSYTISSGSSNSALGIYGTGYNWIPQPRMTPHNFLREIHVGVDVAASNQEIQQIRSDLQGLLANEISMMRQTGGGRPAIYVIAYHFM